MKKLLYYPLALGALLMLSTACEEDNPFGNFGQWQKTFAENYIRAEAAMSDVYSMIDMTMRDSLFAAEDSSLINGAVVTRNGSSILIDYKLGAVSDDGRVREGRIELTQTGEYFGSTGEISVNFDNYKVESQNYSGNIVLKNTGNNSYELSAGNFSVNDYVKLSGSQTISWRQGFNSLENLEDDRYGISGTVTGTDTSSQSITAEIQDTDPLDFDRSCKHKLLGGTVNMSFASDTSTTTGGLDFRSDDGCDNIVDIILEQDDKEVKFTQQFEGF